MDRKERILIVEDEALLSRVMARHLTQTGYEVVGRPASGEEAVLMASETMPDLILMDRGSCKSIISGLRRGQ